MNTDYRLVRKSDAEALAEYLKAVAGDTDNLSFSVSDASEMDRTAEALFIAELKSTPSVFAIAITDGVISGSCDIRISGRVRTKHRGDLSIAVRKEFWSTGIAQHLYEFAVSEARERGVKKIQAETRSDNERAKAFLLRNGFQSEGLSPMLLCVDGEYIDGEHFGLVL